MHRSNCPSFTLYVDGKYFCSYPTRADVYQAIRVLGLYGREIWTKSGSERNRQWCEENEIDPDALYDECHMSTK